MKLALTICTATAILQAFATVPTVSHVSMTQTETSRDVTISYELSDGPAVVTVDIQTNVADDVWASIGEGNFTTMTGDVNAYVTNASCTIRWDARADWPDHKISGGNARAVVTAWALDDTPDYMVVDLANASAQRVAYYVSTNALPGGLLGNSDYRTSKVVMRRIRARGRAFTMGAVIEPGVYAREKSHTATLTNDFYIGVFELTQSQWWQVYTDTAVKAKCAVEGAQRPMEGVTYYRIREAANNTGNANFHWPAPPHGLSFLGLCRTRTICDEFPAGVDFDLPGQAQWEYACRAGSGEGYWNTGAPITDKDADPAMPGRYKGNQSMPGNTSFDSMGPSNCTAIVGSYAPNGWGLYDMHGNVWEYCLDWYTTDSAVIGALGGGVNTTAGTQRVRCGGSWYNISGDSRSSMFIGQDPSSGVAYVGLRLCCRAGLR